ncbi:hypothetical protein [Leifsonia sp. SIMBA_070]|uniref:hypothetical protein n=1 Tax=Leifsonia sp. SIMBA_070 TaxID=3085810 RepID=UPI00397ADB29
MSIATRTARPNGATPMRVTTGAVAMDNPAQPVVVIDLARVARRFHELRTALPWMEVRYDVCALAHPALLTMIAADGAGFVITRDSALGALQRSGAQLSRVIHADPWARRQERRAAWEAGVRRFVIEDARDVDDFAAAPDGAVVLLRLEPDAAVEAARWAARIGVDIAGLSLRLPDSAGASDLLDAVEAAMRTRALIGETVGSRPSLLDLGDAVCDLPGGRPDQVAALGRSIRSLAAPATSRMTVLASTGRAVAADALTVVTGTTERYVDPATASDHIDAGAEVVVLRARRRLPRPARARSTWTPAG